MTKFEPFCMTKSPSKFLIFPFNEIVFPYMDMMLYFKLQELQIENQSNFARCFAVLTHLAQEYFEKFALKRKQKKQL